MGPDRLVEDQDDDRLCGPVDLEGVVVQHLSIVDIPLPGPSFCSTSTHFLPLSSCGLILPPGSLFAQPGSIENLSLSPSIGLPTSAIRLVLSSSFVRFAPCFI